MWTFARGAAMLGMLGVFACQREPTGAEPDSADVGPIGSDTSTPPSPACDDPTEVPGDLSLVGEAADAFLDGFCQGPIVVRGSLTVRDTTLERLILPCVCAVDGDVEVSDNPFLAAVAWDVPGVLPPIGGDLGLRNNPRLASVGIIGDVGGDVDGVDLPALRELHLGAIAGALRWSAAGPDAASTMFVEADAVGGDCVLGPLPPGDGFTLDAPWIGGGLEAVGIGGVVRLDGVATIDGDLDLHDATGLTLDAPALATVLGGASARALDGAQVDVPLLTAIGGGLALVDSGKLVVHAGSDDVSVGGDFVVARLTDTRALTWPVATVGGALDIRDNPDLSTLVTALRTIGGDAAVEGNPALTLVATSSVTVGGDLRLTDDATDGVLAIGPFTGTVPGDLVIERVQIDPDGVCDVTEVGGDLSLTDTSFCPGRTGWLRTIGGAFQVVRATQSPLDSLETIGGDLWVEGTAEFSLSFVSLASIGGDLVLRDNAELVWLSAPLVDALSGVELTNNPVAVGVPYLPLVEELDRLEIRDNALLVALSGVSALTDVGELELIGNPSLVTLSGLDQLEEVDVLWIEDDDALYELDAPTASLERIGELHLLGNASLTALEIDAFLAAVPLIGQLDVFGNG